MPATLSSRPGPDLLLTRLGGVAATRQVRQCGVSADQIARRCRAGRWSVVVPGVVALADGAFGPRERLVAALAFVGHPRAVLSQATAAFLRGLAVGCRLGPEPPDLVDVTVPHGSRRRSAGFVRVHQVRRHLEPDWWSGLPLCGVDELVRTSGAWREPADVRGLVLAAVRDGGLDLDRIEGEAASWRGRGVAEVRAAIEEVRLGSRSPVEGLTYRGVLAAGLPAPELNGRVQTRGGTRYVDLLWRARRFGVEIDRRRFHLDAGRWQSDIARMNALLLEGIVLLRIPAVRVLTELDVVVAEIAEALHRRARELGRQP